MELTQLFLTGRTVHVTIVERKVTSLENVRVKGNQDSAPQTREKRNKTLVGITKEKERLKNTNQFKTHVHALAFKNCERIEKKEKEQFLADLQDDIEDF